LKKVYFACSIRGGRDKSKTYAILVDYLKTRSELLTEIFADQKLTDQGMNKPEADIFKNDMAWVKQADVVVAEVSNPSLGVGYEIGVAEKLNKQVLCLYEKQTGKKLSAMIAGNPRLKIVTYNDISEVYSKIDEFLSN